MTTFVTSTSTAAPSTTRKPAPTTTTESPDVPSPTQPGAIKGCTCCWVSFEFNPSCSRSQTQAILMPVHQGDAIIKSRRATLVSTSTSKILAVLPWRICSSCSLIHGRCSPSLSCPAIGCVLTKKRPRPSAATSGTPRSAEGLRESVDRLLRLRRGRCAPSGPDEHRPCPFGPHPARDGRVLHRVLQGPGRGHVRDRCGQAREPLPHEAVVCE